MNVALEKPSHTIVAITSKWPSGLKSAAEACAELGIAEHRLIQLADDGYAPHYRIDGGDPFFKSSELREWAATNLLTRSKGRDIPRSSVRVVVAPERCEKSRLPLELREMPGLTEISNDVLRSGVYFLCLDDRVVYVGQSCNVYARISQHRNEKTWDRVFYLPLPSDDLDRFEGALIRAFEPALNNHRGGLRDRHLDVQTLDEFRALTR